MGCYEVALTLSSSFTRIRTSTQLVLGFWSIFLCRVQRSIPVKGETGKVRSPRVGSG